MYKRQGVERKYIEEVGAMNVFFVIDDEIVTPVSYTHLRRGFSRCNFSGLDFKHLFLIMSKSPAVGRAFLLHAFALWNLS